MPVARIRHSLSVSAFGGRAALLAGDVAGARRMLAQVEARPLAGALEADSIMLRAGIEAQEGRVGEALAGYQLALARYRDLGLRFDLALTATEMVALLGTGDADVIAAAETARSTLVELGATTLLTRLDALGEGRPPAASSRRPVRARVLAGGN
jgi:hypothetical protein